MKKIVVRCSPREFEAAVDRVHADGEARATAKDRVYGVVHDLGLSLEVTEFSTLRLGALSRVPGKGWEPLDYWDEIDVRIPASTPIREVADAAWRRWNASYSEDDALATEIDAARPRLRGGFGAGTAVAWQGEILINVEDDEKSWVPWEEREAIRKDLTSEGTCTHCGLPAGSVGRADPYHVGSGAKRCRTANEDPDMDPKWNARL